MVLLYSVTVQRGGVQQTKLAVPESARKSSTGYVLGQGCVSNVDQNKTYGELAAS